tara:strand:- start:349 stop:549 length:201 start_codon:yes stop_codon:yes gene_type:complete
MKLLLSVLTIFALTPTINAEGYYLILEKKGTGLERIKMADKTECEDIGKEWSSVSRRHTFICLENR